MESFTIDKHASSSDRIASIYFLLQGIGSLICWNGVLNGLDYFHSRYPAFNAYFLIPIAFNVAQVLANFFMPKLTKIFSLKLRVMIPLVIVICIMLFLPLESVVFGAEAAGFYISLVLIFILGFFNCIYQGTVSGFASQFAPKYTIYLLMGMGLAGLIMNALRSIAIVIFDNPEGSELMEIISYFAVACLFLIACLLIHPKFAKSEFCRTHATTSVELIDADMSYNEQMESFFQPEMRSTWAQKSMSAELRVFKEVKLYVLLLVLNFALSFMVFPGVMLEKKLDFMTVDWKVVSMLATFNLFDVIGKDLAKYRVYYTKWTVMFVMAIRIIFNVFFVIQALSLELFVVSTAWFAYLNIAFFGLTHGFVTAALFIMGPEQVSLQKKETAGYLSIFGLTTGLVLGGVLSLPLSYLNVEGSGH